IRDFHVTGVQTCALPICSGSPCGSRSPRAGMIAIELLVTAPIRLANCELPLFHSSGSPVRDGCTALGLVVVVDYLVRLVSDGISADSVKLPAISPCGADSADFGSPGVAGEQAGQFVHEILPGNRRAIEHVADDHLLEGLERHPGHGGRPARLTRPG